MLHRFMNHVTPEPNSGCWLWTAANIRGYGQFRDAGKTHLAHRWIFEKTNGDIPEGMYVCHSCDNPSCVNPDHLWTGTQKDNIRDCIEKGRHNPIENFRGRGPAKILATHCSQGHPLEGDNLKLKGRRNQRVCRQCWRAEKRRYYAKKRMLGHA